MSQRAPKLLTNREFDASLRDKFKRKEVQMQAYCVKCRSKVEIKGPKAITMKNGRPATQGVCPKCGTKVFRIGKS